MSENNDPVESRFPPEFINYSGGKPQLGPQLRELVEQAVEARWQARLGESERSLQSKVGVFEARLTEIEAKVRAQIISEVDAQLSRLWQGKTSEVEIIVHKDFEGHWEKKIDRRQNLITILGLGGIVALCAFLGASFSSIVYNQEESLFNTYRTERLDPFLKILGERTDAATKNQADAKDLMSAATINLNNVRTNLEGDRSTVNRLQDDTNKALGEAKDAAASAKEATDYLRKLIGKYPKQLQGFFEQANLPVGTVLGLPAKDEDAIEDILFGASEEDQPRRWAILGPAKIPVPRSLYGKTFHRKDVPAAQELEGPWLSSPDIDPKSPRLIPVIKIN